MATSAPAQPPAAPAGGGYDSLIQLAVDTSTQLNAIWTEVGLNDEEKAAQIVSLNESLQAVLKKRVADEQRLAEQYRMEVETLATGLAELAARVGAPDPNPDVPAEETANLTRHLTWLRAKKEELEAERERLESEIRVPLDAIHEIWTEMGTEFEPDFSDAGAKLDAARLLAVQDKLACVKRERSNRVKALEHEISGLRTLFEELDVLGNEQPEPSKGGCTELDRKILDDAGSLGISWQILDALASRTKELSAEKREREATLKSLGAAITPLWDKLKVPEPHRQAFFTENVGLGLGTVRRCESELARLRTLKKESLSKLIADAAGTIAALWDEIGIAEALRVLPDIAQAGAGEDEGEEVRRKEGCLEAHEKLVGKLEARAAKIRPILKAIAKRDECLAARTEFETSQKDPDRLTMRGAKLTKQLFHEESLQKKIKLLPKVEAKIRQRVREWEHEHKMAFMFNGAKLLATIAKEAEEYKKKRHDKEAARKAANVKKMKHEIDFGTKLKKKKRGVASGRKKAASLRGKPKSRAKRPAGKAGTVGSTRAPLSGNGRALTYE